MSRLTNTKRAYETLANLLDQEIRNRRGGRSTDEITRVRQNLDVAFYLLGWAQFEYLVRRQTTTIVEKKSSAKAVEGLAWKYLRDNIANFKVRSRLDLAFHADPTTRGKLHKDYDLRNEAAHDYRLPIDAIDISNWLQELEELVDKFES